MEARHGLRFMKADARRRVLRAARNKPKVRNDDGGGGAVYPGSFEGSAFIKRVQLSGRTTSPSTAAAAGSTACSSRRSGTTAAPAKPSTPRTWATRPRFWTVGLFQSGKTLPPQLNLVLEIEFAEAADALWPDGAGCQSYSIENVRVLASQVTLDSALVESFNKWVL